MVTITSYIFINIIQTVHFSAVKFTRGNEKNMSFLLIPKSPKLWEKSEAIGPGTFNGSENNSRRPVWGNKVLYYIDTHYNRYTLRYPPGQFNNNFDLMGQSYTLVISTGLQVWSVIDLVLYPWWKYFLNYKNLICVHRVMYNSRHVDLSIVYILCWGHFMPKTLTGVEWSSGLNNEWSHFLLPINSGPLVNVIKTELILIVYCN